MILIDPRPARFYRCRECDGNFSSFTGATRLCDWCAVTTNLPLSYDRNPAADAALWDERHWDDSP